MHVYKNAGLFHLRCQKCGKYKGYPINKTPHVSTWASLPSTWPVRPYLEQDDEPCSAKS